MRVCFVSNGRGEDQAAAWIAARLVVTCPVAQVVAASLVTRGDAYRAKGIPVVVSGTMPWSGGFTTTSWAAVARDATWTPDAARFVRALSRRRGDTDVVIVVGDVFLLAIAALAFRRRAIFVALARSNAATPHSRLERVLIRRLAHAVLTRDAATSDGLRAQRVDARYVGNPLMDGLPVRQSSRAAAEPCVLLLPGSRAEAPENLARMLAIVERVATPTRWLLAAAPWTPRGDLVETARRAGWEVRATTFGRDLRCIELASFEDAVAQADLAIGVAGTANEQTAGLGCPVVTFVGAGPQACRRRLRKQERLLNGGARFIDDGPAGVAAEVDRLLAAPEERAARGAAGRASMGLPGADRIAHFLAAVATRTDTAAICDTVAVLAGAVGHISRE